MPKLLGIVAGLDYSGSREIPEESSEPDHLKWRETYAVRADTVGQAHFEIEATPGLPKKGDVRDGGRLAVKRVKPREVDPYAKLWHVGIEWDSRVDTRQQGDDPTLWRPKVNWTTEHIRLHLPVDQVTGEAIANVNGEPYYVETEYPVPVRSFTRFEARNVLTEIDDLQLTYCKHVNRTDFWGWPRNTVLMAEINAEDNPIGDVLYSRVTYVTKYLPLLSADKVVYIEETGPRTVEGTIVDATHIIGWQLNLLHEGTFARAYDAGSVGRPPEDNIVPFLDLHGNPVKGNLDPNGLALPDGDDPDFLQFHRYPYAEFNDLQI